MIPVWLWWPALILTIAAGGALLLWHTTTTIAAGTDGRTWRRVRVFAGHAAGHALRVAVAGRRFITKRRDADVARMTAPLPPARADLTIIGHRSDETAAPWPAGYLPRHHLPPTIGEIAQAVRFPADTQEFSRVFGTVEIGATL